MFGGWGSIFWRRENDLHTNDAKKWTSCQF